MIKKAGTFPEFHVHHFEVLDSTMTKAGELARKGCPDFTVVIADRQEKGRGRLKRKWISAEGGLYFTIVIRTSIPPEKSGRINFAASLSLSLTLERLFGVRARVKWPNDILVNEKKIVGMLSEMAVDKDRVDFVNLGIGINVNNDPFSEEPGADSLKRILGRELSRKKILEAFLLDLKARLEEDLDDVIPQWKTRSITPGRRVKIVTRSETLEGKALDVDEDGALILKLVDGTLKKVIYGDCFHG